MEEQQSAMSVSKQLADLNGLAPVGYSTRTEQPSALFSTVHEDCSGRQRKEDSLDRPASKKLYRREGSVSEISRAQGIDVVAI